MAKPGIATRRAAWEALERVLQDRQMLKVRGDLTPPETARANRLCLITLRHLGRIDALLRPYLRKAPTLQVQLLLRLGAAELLVEDAAAHGVVDSYVTLAKQLPPTRRASGLVNAVLRKISNEAKDLWSGQKPQRMPTWMRKKLISAHGSDVVEAIETAHEAGAPIDLTLRKPVEIEGAKSLPTGSLRLAPGAQVSALPGYDDGAFWVQDAAAALPARMLGDVAGKEVLDLCAAPGGKTMQLAAAGAKVTALDNSAKRLERLEENLARTGLKATVVTEDALSFKSGPFDAILLDAPCSATGTLRRHPELPFIRTAEDVAELSKLQAQMIDAATALLKQGGRLVYCTCSLLPSEGEDQIDAALTRHETLSPVSFDPKTLGGDTAWSAPHGAIRLRPDFWSDTGGMDGFYMAALDKR